LGKVFRRHNTNKLVFHYVPEMEVGALQLWTLGFCKQVFLVREEYGVTYEQMVCWREKGVGSVAIIGQPGIGK